MDKKTIAFIIVIAVVLIIAIVVIIVVNKNKSSNRQLLQTSSTQLKGADVSAGDVLGLFSGWFGGGSKSSSSSTEYTPEEMAMMKQASGQV